jgi:hypothetical protein
MNEDVLVTKQFVDDEIASRIQKDLNISGFIGLGVDGSSEPVSATPNYGSLIDLVDEESLTESLGRLDRVKNSKQSITLYNNATLVNPRFVRLSSDLGRLGIYPDSMGTSTGYRVNINTVSSAPFIKSVTARWGSIAVIKSSTYGIVALNIDSDYVRLQETV